MSKKVPQQHQKYQLTPEQELVAQKYGRFEGERFVSLLDSLNLLSGYLAIDTPSKEQKDRMKESLSNTLQDIKKISEEEGRSPNGSVNAKGKAVPLTSSKYLTRS